MASGLIGLIILVIIVGIVLYLCKMLVDMIPMDESFKRIAWILMVLVAVLIVIQKALPLLGIASPF